MKFKSLFLALSLMALPAGVSAMDHSNHNMHKDMHGEMHNNHGSHGGDILSLMHEPMMAQPMSKSGNADADFLIDMIPHHQGAIDSAKVFLNTAKNEKLIKLAHDIIRTQTAEIEMFNNILKKGLNSTKLSKKDYEAYIAQAKKDMDKMMDEMMKVKASGNDDKDFAAAMIAHHQGAVESSKNILKYTKDAQIKKIAEDIIKAQEKEIKDMQEVLKQY